MVCYLPYILLSSQLGPNIVKVFPDPVWPYANIVELNPFVTSVTLSMIIIKYILNYLEQSCKFHSSVMSV